jgi:hypothetical protein
MALVSEISEANLRPKQHYITRNMVSTWMWLWSIESFKVENLSTGQKIVGLDREFREVAEIKRLETLQLLLLTEGSRRLLNSLSGKYFSLFSRLTSPQQLLSLYQNKI